MTPARVFITRRIPPPAVELLTAGGLNVEMRAGDTPIGRGELLLKVRWASALICTLTDRVDDTLLDAAGPTLRIVANFAVGYDNIDLEACRRRGVVVTNTPDVLTEATADLAWALILAAARRVLEGDRMVRGGQWTGWEPLQLLGLELRGAALGILGAGRIGTAVGLRAAGFGMNVLYTHPRENTVLEQKVAARRVPLDQLVAESDVLTLHVPMRPENRHLLSAERLRRMKPGAILVNTSRGAIVDEAALVDALRNGQLMAAGLDVYENEPRLAPGLAGVPNVVLLPHLGSATHATRERMSEMAAENVLAVLNGGAAPNRVI